MKTAYDFFFEKIAFDEKDAAKLFKAHGHRIEKSNLAGIEEYGYDPLTNKITVSKNFNPKNIQHMFILGHEVSEHRYKKDQTLPTFKRFSPIMRKLQKIFVPKIQSGEIKYENLEPMIKYLNDKAFNKGYSAHASPRVILSEHNMATTSSDPKIKAFLKETNRIEEAAPLERLIPGYKHGQSPRLSRHALKNVYRILQK